MIIPAIIPKSFEHLEKTLQVLDFSKVIQIDVVDGKFVPFISWPYELSESLGKAKTLLEDFEVEVDLMVEEPIEAAQEWTSVGVNRLIFHIESLDEPIKAISFAKSEKIEIFFSLNNDTDLDKIYPYVNQIDGVQLMGIDKIGQQGQPFDSRVLSRIVTLKSLFPSLIISVDGGVNKETLHSLHAAGADRFVSGSAILSAPEPDLAYEELLKIIS